MTKTAAASARSSHRRLATPTLIAIVATELVALGCVTIPLMLGLAMAVNRIDTGLAPETAASVVAALGAAAAIVSNPVLGAWSDRLRHRWPGRAAFVLGGVLVGSAGLVVTTRMESVLGLTLAWMLVQVSFNATFVALYGLIADLVDESDRARVSGWFGAAAVSTVVVGMGIVAVLPKTVAVVMLTMPVLAVPVAVAAFWHLARLPRPDAAAPGRVPGSLRGRRNLRILEASPQYWLVWVQRFLVQFAFGIVSIYGLFYLMRRADLPEAEAATWVAVASAGAAALSMVASVVGGTYAGRRPSYGPFIVVSVGLIGAAVVIKGLGTSPWAFAVAMALAGIGIGAYFAVDLALALRTVTAERAGLLLGFFSVARTLPQSLVPALAPLMLAIGSGDLIGDDRQNYAALYAVGLVVVIASLVPLRRMTVLRRGSGGA